LADRSALPVDLDVHTDGPLPDPIEVAAYYIVSEALTNTAKHAHASKVAVRVDATDARLRVAIRDDGVGGAEFGRGSGLVGLRDRVEALGGWITLESEPAAGTSLEVELPLIASVGAHH
jgi:signal transduction histidine kinase